MTGGAATLAFEDSTAARRVASLNTRRIEGVHVAQIRGDAGHLRVVERKRRHACRLRAGSDEAREFVVSGCVAELAAAQVDAGNRVALDPVARDASRRI